jgi:biotin transporter BioY
MKRRIAAVLAMAAVLIGASTVPVFADAGGGPGRRG